ncbi:MAG TPA: fatty acid desaturase [Pirellulaceae bacterium]|nr:fatty acid desaturase [Pirellulaceae bacterium]
MTSATANLATETFVNDSEPRDHFDASGESVDDVARIKAITVAIKDADRRMRERFKFLKYQDAIGLGWLIGLTTLCVISSGLFVYGLIPWWLCLIVNAIALSMVRELEHDLVHNLYFKDRKSIQNAMMAVVWPLLGNLPHPWFRREMHLLHHRTSGHDEDFEERLIGNGMKFGPLKILAMIEPGLALLFRKKEMQQIPFYDGRKLTRAVFPVVFVYHTILALFVLGNLAWWIVSAAGVELATGGTWSTILSMINTIAVVWLLPNMLRQTSVQILSSWMHYHGDVESRLEETQVLNAWYFFPLNLFAANFGSTHSIHHFFVVQPFYLRQMVARDAHAAFQKYGIRYNDAASLLRGNRLN